MDDLESKPGTFGQRSWGARWADIGEAHRLVGDLNLKNGAFSEAVEAWLCALTAFEVAKRLFHGSDLAREDVLAKVEGSLQQFGTLEQKLEQVRILCDDQIELPALYFLAGPHHSTPAVICISREDETAAALLGRLLPVVVNRAISVLVVSHDDIPDRWRGESNFLLSCCLDFLSLRPEIDATRIGVYGDGLCAALATSFAASDRRISAAVCDGGLWNWGRNLASIRWLTGTASQIDGEVELAARSSLVRQLRCPILVVAGGEGTVSVPEALNLRADCAAACIDLELLLPRTTRTPAGDIENFVTSDDCIFGWLERKLTGQSVCSSLSLKHASAAGSLL
ncbi:alpha/beta hydrolase family protein [Bradyrhizobium sp. USDA 223]|uniref:alpha/beta hydrolase family protein n=1 Tax=Bradyrhizobium sp. USDA 223 TaxID=3156306 RepID=UPI00384CE180